MQRLLNPSEVAKIDARLHDNALLQACRKVWPGRQDEITSVMARSEDIFCESAWLMDELIGRDEDIDAFAESIWNALDTDNKVSLFVRYIDIATGEADSRIINKNK